MIGQFWIWTRRFAPALALACFCSAAFAGDPVSIDGAWARRSTRPHVMFVYLTISLGRGASDVLVGASSPIAASVDLLAPAESGEAGALEPVLAIELENHVPTILQPGSEHLILRGVRQRLKPGDQFIVTLRFANAGAREVSVTVLDAPPETGMPLVPKGIKLD